MLDNTAMKIDVFDEWYKRGVTNKIIAEQIKRMGYGGQRLICDSAEPKSIAELQDEGLRAESSRKGKDSVKPRHTVDSKLSDRGASPLRGVQKKR